MNTMKKIAAAVLTAGMLLLLALPKEVLAANGSTVIYIRTNDVCYHEQTCVHLGGAGLPCTLQQAVGIGLHACPDCKPPALDETAAPAAAAAPAAPAMVTPEQAVQQAYAVYVQSGFDSASAMARVQARLTQIVSNPNSIADMVKEDAAALQAAVPQVQAVTGYTPEQIVQTAYAVYIQSGLDSQTALAKVQAKTAEFLANPNGIAAIVQADLAAAAAPAPAPAPAAAPAAPAAPAAAAPAATSLTPEQIVQTAYAAYVQAGIDSQTALQRVQAKTAEFIANPGSIASLVQTDIQSMAAPAAAAAPASGGTTAYQTLEQIVHKAFGYYVKAGADTATASARVQKNFAKFLAQPDQIEQLVAADMAALAAPAPAAAPAAAPASGLSTDAIIQQAYATCIAQGMTPDQAFAHVQANLKTILGL